MYTTFRSTGRSCIGRLAKSWKKSLELSDQIDWQSRELVAAGYAQDKNVFTASTDRISIPFYIQRDSDLEGARRYATAAGYAEAHLDTSSKSRLGIAIRYAKYIINVYEEFTGNIVSRERSIKGKTSKVREFLELGVNYFTGGKLTVAQIGYVIRCAAEERRKQL